MQIARDWTSPRMVAIYRLVISEVGRFPQLRAVLFEAFAVVAASAPFEDLAGPGHRRVPSAVEVMF
jgi:hypothetical protein